MEGSNPAKSFKFGGFAGASAQMSKRYQMGACPRRNHRFRLPFGLKISLICQKGTRPRRLRFPLFVISFTEGQDSGDELIMSLSLRRRTTPTAVILDRYSQAPVDYNEILTVKTRSFA